MTSMSTCFSALFGLLIVLIKVHAIAASQQLVGGNEKKKVDVECWKIDRNLKSWFGVTGRPRPTLFEALGSVSVLHDPGRFTTTSNLIGSKEFPCVYKSGDVEKLTDATMRGLNFLEKYFEVILNVSNVLDLPIGLAVLEGMKFMDIRQMRSILQAYPNIQSLYTLSFQNLLQRSRKISWEFLDVVEDKVCEEDKEKLGILRRNLQIVWTGQSGSWENYDKILNSKYEKSFPNLGNERDATSLDQSSYVECLIAIQECEIPYKCGKFYLNNNIEQSQYTLTHQIMYLNIIERKSCAQKHPTKLQNWKGFRNKLCAKAYKEAELISSYGFPASHRDLFSEYVTVCRLAGYPNFLRRDWLNEILSWQSKSEYGCFLEQYNGTPMITSDVPVARLPVKDEVNPTGEKCLPHFTTVALSELSLHLGRLFDVCPAIH